jgi:hypothetical protein
MRQTRGLRRFGDALDHAALAGGITPFEDDDHFELFVLHPILQLDQFALEPKQLLEIDRTGERRTVVMDRMDCPELFEMAFVELQFALFVKTVLKVGVDHLTQMMVGGLQLGHVLSPWSRFPAKIPALFDNDVTGAMPVLGGARETK